MSLNPGVICCSIFDDTTSSFFSLTTFVCVCVILTTNMSYVPDLHRFYFLMGANCVLCETIMDSTVGRRACRNSSSQMGKNFRQYGVCIVHTSSSQVPVMSCISDPHLPLPLLKIHFNIILSYAPSFFSVNHLEAGSEFVNIIKINFVL